MSIIFPDQLTLTEALERYKLYAKPRDLSKYNPKLQKIGEFKGRLKEITGVYFLAPLSDTETESLCVTLIQHAELPDAGLMMMTDDEGLHSIKKLNKECGGYKVKEMWDMYWTEQYEERRREEI